MTTIKTNDYENDLTKSVSNETQKMCSDTFKEIKLLAVRMEQYKNQIRLNEFKLGALLKDHDLLSESRKNFKETDEVKIFIKSIVNKIEEVRAELCVDTHFIRDLNNLTSFDYYKKQKVSA